MADKEKKVTQDSKVDKATTEESKAAEKVAKAAKGSKSNKPNFFARAGKSIKRFVKDFKGETKKIVWPDAKTVLKNTGIVLVVVAIVTAVVFAIDFGLETGIVALKEVAIAQNESNKNAGTEENVATNTDATPEDDEDEKETDEDPSDKAEDETEGDDAADEGEETTDTQEDENAEESAE